MKFPYQNKVLLILSLAIITISFYRPSVCSYSPSEVRTPEQKRFAQAVEAVKSGDLATVQRFVQDFPEFWRFKVQNGGTLMHIAVGWKQLSMVNYLLEQDPLLISLKMVDSNFNTPLDYAEQAMNWDILRPMDNALFKERLSAERSSSSASSSDEGEEKSPQSFTPSIKTTDPSKSLLFQSIAAIQKDKKDSLIKFLSQNPNLVNMQDSKGRTLLFVAAENGKNNIVDYLLNNYALDPNIPNRGKITPLAKAITMLSQAEGQHKQAYRAIIEQLQNSGGKIFAQAYVLYEPTQFYQEEVAELARRNILPAYPQVNLLPEDNLHITFAYVSVPMDYVTNEGEPYLAQAFSIRHRIIEILKNSDIQRKLKNMAQGQPFEADPVVKPVGPFLVISYRVPAAYDQILSEFYQTVFNRMHGTIKMYDETLAPHLSIAKKKPGISKSDLSAETFSSLNNIQEKFGGKFRVGVRIPSVEAPGYKDIQ